VILNSPCNPTGYVTTDAELTGLAALLDEHARRTGRTPALIVDEVYFRMLFPPAVRVEPFARYSRTLLARSFSKDLGIAGERIGYLAVHPQLASGQFMRGLEVCQRALGFVNAPATMQRMLLHLDGFDVDVEAHRARRDHALGAARGAGLQPFEPQGGLYLWIPSPWNDGLAYVQALAAQRVLVAPGIAFGAPEFLRVCISAPEEVLTRALTIAGEVAAREQLTA
jgi:aspartate aminotransferase